MKHYDIYPLRLHGDEWQQLVGEQWVAVDPAPCGKCKRIRICDDCLRRVDNVAWSMMAKQEALDL